MSLPEHVCAGAFRQAARSHDKLTRTLILCVRGQTWKVPTHPPGKTESHLEHQTLQVGFPLFLSSFLLSGLFMKRNKAKNENILRNVPDTFSFPPTANIPEGTYVEGVRQVMADSFSFLLFPQKDEYRVLAQVYPPRGLAWPPAISGLQFSTWRQRAPGPRCRP